MKTLLTVLLLLVTMVARPSDIKYYDFYPNNANPPGTYIISIQTLDKSVGGTPYNFWTLNQMVAWLQLRGFTNGSGTVINIITNNIFVTTNITVEVPGGVTNLNLTPKSLMWSDVNDAEASIPNAAGVLTNDGSGGIGFSTSLSLTELDALNFFPTNMFTGRTNYSFLGTDGDGLLNGGELSGDVTTSGSRATTLATVNASPGTYGDGTHVAVVTVNAKGLATTVSQTSITGAAPSGTAGGDLFGAYPNPSVNFLAPTNNSIALSNNLTAALSAALVSPTNKFGGDGSGLTNLTYKYTTNIVGAANFVFGKAYWTNITGNFTFPALTIDPAAFETLAVLVTNSGASTFTATINGVAGAPGHVVPAVFYCTNSTVTEIDLSHFGVLWTNACVSKN